MKPKTHYIKFTDRAGEVRYLKIEQGRLLSSTEKEYSQAPSEQRVEKQSKGLNHT